MDRENAARKLENDLSYVSCVDQSLKAKTAGESNDERNAKGHTYIYFQSTPLHCFC